MRKWETSDFPLQPPLSLSSAPSFSLCGAELNLFFFLHFHSTSKIFQSQLQSHLCFPTRFHILLTVFFCVSPVDFGGEGDRGWVSYITPWIWLYMHGNMLGVLISQGRFLFINEEEEGGHTNTSRWWRAPLTHVAARGLMYALTSCFFVFCFFRRICLDICLK